MIKEIQELNIELDDKNKDKFIDLSEQELILLMNEIYYSNSTELKIFDCLYGLELFKAHLKEPEKEIIIDLGKILLTIPKAGEQTQFLNKRISDVKFFERIPRKIFQDLPHRGHFKDSIRKSGIFFNKNVKNKIKTEFKELISSDPLKNYLPTAFAFDTCTYSNQTFSHIHRYWKKISGRSNRKLNFLVSSGVINELSVLENVYDKKQYTDHLKYLSQIACYPNVIKNFWRQPILKTRLTYLGRGDYLRCKRFANAKIIDDGISQDPDVRIISGLASEIRKNPMKLYLYSHDKDFCTASQTGYSGLVCKRLYYGKIEDDLDLRFSFKWTNFTTFLYYLSVIFGAIIITNDNYENPFILFGIWKAKNSTDWQLERIRVYSEIKLLSNIRKDLKILNNIKREASL